MTIPQEAYQQWYTLSYCLFILAQARKETEPKKLTIDFHKESRNPRWIHACWFVWRIKYIWTYGGFLKWWYPTTFGFPTKNDHFGMFWGYHHLRKRPYIILYGSELAVVYILSYYLQCFELKYIQGGELSHYCGPNPLWSGTTTLGDKEHKGMLYIYIIYMHVYV